MNIFAVSHCPETAGTVLPDKLCVKMVVEAAQMLSTALRQHGYDNTDVYKSAHPGHPCTKWTASTRDNFIWHWLHGMAIAAEYTRRYGRTHKSQAIIERCGELVDIIPQGDLEPFAQAMPDELKHATDATVAYRRFMKTKPYWGEKAFRKGRDFTSFYVNTTDTQEVPL